MRTSLQQARSLRAAALLALLVFAQLSSVAHQAAGAHRACEHGQVVEAEQTPGALAHEVGEQDGEHLLAPDSSRAEAGHVHCLASALLRTATACASPALPFAAGLAALHSIPAAAAARALPREVLLLLAPKGSPPA